MISAQYTLKILSGPCTEIHRHFVVAEIHVHSTELTQQLNGLGIVTSPRGTGRFLSTLKQAQGLRIASSLVALSCHALKEPRCLISHQLPLLNKICAKSGLRYVIFYPVQGSR